MATEVARRRRQWRGGVFDLHVRPKVLCCSSRSSFLELAKGSNELALSIQLRKCTYVGVSTRTTVKII